MGIDSAAVRTLTFDSFTTIVDVIGSTNRALSAHLDQPEPVTKLWRHRAVEYRMLSNFVGSHETYYETTRDALRYALRSSGIDLSPEEIDEVTSVFYELDVFEDVYECFETLARKGHDSYILSNGDAELLEAMVDRAAINEFIADTISAEEIQTYKPDVEFYRYAEGRTDTAAENVLHVATPWYDIYGAANVGMQTVWVNRTNSPWEEFNGEPDAVIDSLAELPTLLD
jgi:2-haloacid dehalogenase